MFAQSTIYRSGYSPAAVSIKHIYPAAKVGTKILRNWLNSFPDLIQDISWKKDSTK